MYTARTASCNVSQRTGFIQATCLRSIVTSQVIMARSFFLFLFVRLADVTCFPSISLQNNKVTQAITSIQHLCLLSKRAWALLSFAAAEQSLKMLLKS